MKEVGAKEEPSIDNGFRTEQPSVDWNVEGRIYSDSPISRAFVGKETIKNTNGKIMSKDNEAS